MRARLKTWITLSLALHLAVLAWAAPGRKDPIPAGAAAVRWNAVMVDLPSPAGALPAVSREIPPAPEAVPPPPVDDTVAAAGTGPGPEGSVPEGSVPEESGPAEIVPVRIVRNEEFARMAYIREMSSKTMSYHRSAPKEFEEILRSALPSDAFHEGENATVSIELSPAGYITGVDIRSDSPALLSALRGVRWETSPLPVRHRIPCNKVELNVSVNGKRLAVGMKVL